MNGADVKVWLCVIAGLWSLSNGYGFTQAAGPEGGARPAKVVTRYALTSTHDFPLHDPKAWRLLGSNDEGKTWTLLDTRTNQYFKARSQRRAYRIGNRSAFNIYRLQVDEANSTGLDVFENDTSVQLADLELLGPAARGPGEAEWQSIITASDAHPLIGPAENAFDNDPATRWFDLALWHGKECWIQCQYALRHEVVVTNISQMEVLTRLAWTSDAFPEKGQTILSNLMAGGKGPRVRLTGYALTSANDSLGRDPRDWRLLGSNDEGRSWAVLDTRQGEVFANRFQRRVFALTNQDAYSVFRLEISATRGAEQMVQLGEVEPLGLAEESQGGLTLVVSSRADNPPMEAVEMAFDGDPNTKWLSFFSATPAEPAWIQWHYVPGEEDLPVVNRHTIERLADELRLAKLKAQTQRPVRALKGYALTSANDSPDRDPRDWRLLGSNDGGRTWQLLDARHGETFGARFQRRVFPLARKAEYATYRLEIESVADPGKADSVQLAELEPLPGRSGSQEPLSVIVSAQGDNPPVENSEKLFDGDPKTKWLDFADAEANRASWVEWHYASGLDKPVISLDRLCSAHAPPRPALRLGMEGVVVATGPMSGQVDLLDETGFQPFVLDPPAANLRAGQRVRLSGKLRLGGQCPVVLDAEAVPLGRLTNLPGIRGEQPLEAGQGFFMGTVQGRVTAITPEYYYATVALGNEDGTRGLVARILGPKDITPPYAVNCRVQVRGVVEPVFSASGQRVAGVIWVDSLEDVGLVEPTAEEWRAWPDYSVRGAWRTNLPPTQMARVHGSVVEQKPGESLVLGEGTNRLMAYSSQKGVAPAGTAVEAAGLLGRQDTGTPVLYGAYWRPREAAKGTEMPGGAAAPASPVQPLSRVQAIREFMNAHPGQDFPVKLGGVITYIDLGLGDFYLYDGAESIDVWSQFGAGVSPFQQQEGMFVEMEGVVHRGHVFPTHFVKVLGKGQMPPPLRHPWEYLMTGRDDDQWVEVEGVVAKVEKQRLTLLVSGQPMVAWVNDLGKGAQGAFLGSLVRASGVCEPVLNNHDQRLGLRLLVPSCEYIQTVQAAPEHPFELATVPIGKVMQADSDNAGPPTRLVKTKGIVTYAEPRLVFIQNETEGLRVVPQQDAAVQPGDVVEVVGLSEPDGLSPKLVRAQFRKVGQARLPQARPLDASDEAVDRQEENLDALRVRLDAILVGWVSRGRTQVLELQLEKTRRTFLAFRAVGSGPLPRIPAGSRVRLEGVFKARTELAPDLEQTVSSFELYLSGPADVVVLARPSWWTPQHTFLMAGGLGLVLLLVLGWVALLRRQVQAQTEVIRQKLEEGRQIAESLAREKNLLATLFDHLPDMVFIKDAQRRFVLNNKAHSDYYGMPQAQLLGKSGHDILPPELACLYDEADERILSKEIEKFEAEQPAMSRDRGQRWLAVTKVPLKDGAGKVIGLVGISRDITEAKDVHKELVEASRQAGMAEVASSVLHNVGNVLNSVNVSTSLLSEQLRKSKLPNLARTADLMAGHSADLAQFLTGDPKGRQLPGYLAQLSAHLADEQGALLEEVQSLSRNVEHIKEIINMQQGYAKVLGVAESVQVKDLVEDALRMNAGALVRHDIQVSREYNSEMPSIRVEKHKVLQVLVNLVQNAMHACDDSGRAEKRVTVKACNGGDKVRISVCDNGVGIAAENMTKIFNHGFTTRKNGHGFGLHSGALAAKEMGGALLAKSDGPGQGATFILELPVGRG
ncbi:MAG: two-component system sensor histidine kinase NtrB [Limisphaerales bacterium]